jgi:RHS repeat-associated protein
MSRENRLVAVAPVGTPASGDKRLDFQYDYRGRRVEKVYSTYDAGGEVWVEQWTERYVYDDWNVVLVLDDSNDTVRKYTWGLDLSRTLHGAGGIGGLLAAVETQGTSQTNDDEMYWFLYDANGNVGQVLDATDHDPVSDMRMVAHYKYDPYGNVSISNNNRRYLNGQVQTYDTGYANDNPIRFSTKWFDTELAGAGVNGAVGESGLGYWGYRYYSPRLGRWINRDPVEELGGLNLNAALLNGPIDHADPDGRALVSAVVSTIMLGNAASNLIQACYCCYLFGKCKFNAIQAAQAAMAQWNNLLATKTGEDYVDTLANAKRQMLGAGFGTECADLGACCLKKGAKAVLWITGRYFTLKVILQN